MNVKRESGLSNTFHNVIHLTTLQLHRVITADYVNDLAFHLIYRRWAW